MTVIVERPERRAGDLQLVLVAVVGPGDVRPVEVGDDLDDAGHGARRLLIDTDDPPFGDRGLDDVAVQQVRHGMLGGVARRAGDLLDAIDAVDRAADPDLRCGSHDVRILTRRACRSAIAGWPSAACLSARTIALRASGILKSFSPCPTAPASSASAKAPNACGDGCCPFSCSSASLRATACARRRQAPPELQRS